MALRHCAGALGLIVCAAMLASCAQLSAVRNALFDDDSDAGEGQAVRLPDPPAHTPKADGQTDYVTFVQEVMAESAKLGDRATPAAKATRAATAWRGAAGGGQEAESE